MNKNCLIAYATKHGQTEKIARFIEHEATRHGWHVDTLNVKNDLLRNTVKSYDVILFGGSIHYGRFPRELIRFFKKNKEDITFEKSHLFVVSLASANSDARLKNEGVNSVRKMIRRLPVRFSSVEYIAGALSYTKYNWIVQLMMKWIAGKSGGDTDITKDYEYTNFEQIKSYTDVLFPELVDSSRHTAKTIEQRAV